MDDDDYDGQPARSTGGEMDFVSDRYEFLVRQQEDLTMAVPDFVYKVEPVADSEWSQEEAPDPET